MAIPQYTGQGLQAPRTQGRALQALSQFGQQEQIRNSQAIQQGVRDRDKFADMLAVDPVYATSQGLQQKIASSMDNFQDEMTALNKSRRGVMTTEDLMKMQQSRGRVMAEMQHYKSIDDQMLQGGQMVNQRPDLYDSQLYHEAVQHVQETGEAPPQGFVFKAVQDPFLFSEQMLNSANMGWAEEDIFTGTVGGVHQYEKKGGYRLNDRSPTDTVNRMLKDPQLQYHVQMSFDRLPEEQRNRYLSQAQGNETAAANEWYRRNMIPELSRKTVGGESEKTRAAYKAPEVGRREGYDMTYTHNFEEGFIGNEKTMQKDVIYDYDTGEISFTNDIVDGEMMIDVGKVKFDKDVDLGDMDQIKLIAQKSIGSDKVQWEVADGVNMIDRGVTAEEGRIKYPNWAKMTKKKRMIPVKKQKEGLVKGRILKQTEVKDETVFDVEVPLSGQVATSLYKDVSSELDAEYRQQLKPFWREMMGKGKSTPKQKANTYAHPNGYSYTKQELLDAGYSEDQIEQLNGE